jgi:hypothetical protein
MAISNSGVLKRRAWNEKASAVREHPEAIRYVLLGCFLHVRTMEVLDDVIRMAIDIVHRVDVRSDHQLHRELIENLKHVDGKLLILSRIAEAVVTGVREQRNQEPGYAVQFYEQHSTAPFYSRQMETREALHERVRREQQLMDRLRTAAVHFTDAQIERAWAISSAHQSGYPFD